MAKNPKTKKRPIASSPSPGSPEWAAMHTTVAVMVSGKRRHIAEFLRGVARSIDMGCTSGISGDASQVRGEWLGSR